MRLAIAGLGVQGRKRLAVAGPDVAATIDPVTDAADYRSIEDVPLDTFDAACVCTPDEAKLDILRYLLARGKHVLVEKPLLADPPAFDELIGLARSTGAACYTAYNHRFEPHLVRLHETIRSGSLGEVYLARFFYGNGTARDVRNSPWRDRGLGVLSDLGSHLIDLALFLFGDVGGQYEVWSASRFENRSFDHVLFGLKARPVLAFEATLLSWRNTFAAEVFGERGSAHVHGLCKWGPSTFTVRRRVLPSGPPAEETQTLAGPDPTWAAEYEWFKALCRAGGGNIETDRRIAAALQQLGSRPSTFA